MGSVLSHHTNNQPIPHECFSDSCHFQVSHVDGNIKTIVRGQLEINDRSLAFSYVENGTMLKLDWPFTVIRNYGRTTDFLFMIEVGRKSLTGDGYFFFKSRQASGVKDCLQRHLRQHQEEMLRRRKFRRSSSASSRQDNRDSHGFRDKEPSAPSISSGSLSDPYEGDGSYTSSHHDIGNLVTMAPSGGYVVPVFQRQDSQGDDEPMDSVEHDYVNQNPVPHAERVYINVQVEETQPPRPARLPTASPSGVEYSTVISSLPQGQLLGNDYSNLPSLETLPHAL